jgi:hypothetical protein
LYRGGDKQVAMDDSALPEVVGAPDVMRSPAATETMTEKPAVNSPTRYERHDRSRRWLFLLLAILGAILAAVIAAVVSWKVTSNAYRPSAAASSTPAVASPGDSPATLAPGANRTIMPASSFSATAWRWGTGSSIRLFYQGPDNAPRYSEWSSIYQTWSVPFSIPVMAANMTPLAATTLYYQNSDASLPDGAQTIVYYANPDGGVQGQNWGEGWTPAGMTDLVDTSHINFTRTTSAAVTAGGHPLPAMAAWFPYVVGIDGTGQGSLYLSQWGVTYSFVPLNVTANPRSPLFVVPTVPFNKDQGIRIYYQGSDLSLYSIDVTPSDSSAGPYTVSQPSQLPFTSQAPLTALAGFVTARDNSTVNTYLLWQEPRTGAVNIAQNDSPAGWRGPTSDDVFKGVDNPSHLACATAASSVINGGPTVGLVVGANDLNRCYFQAGGVVREVWFDGGTWKDFGVVRMP